LNPESGTIRARLNEVIDTNIAETVVLTGASGFIAKHTIVQLFNAGY
jgi:hypothetical protein